MATEYRSYAVIVPAGATIAAPNVQALAMPARIVTSIRVRVPPGPRGNLGFRLTSNRQAVIPADGLQWVVADDEVLEWPVENALQTGVWECTAYNSGVLPHTVYFLFALEPLSTRSAAPGPSPLTVTA
ncbi:MAG TPA: hypothetical protein VMD08_03870 [Candidatus Baltobacteraceae bacterium]|nr:hypothetical protein [Candidatus Baltobacteraceae bacterium]